MNELIKEVLDEYFADFKKYHLIVLICFTLLNFTNSSNSIDKGFYQN